MAATESTMVPLGTPAPDFQLPDTNGKIVRRDEFTSAPGLLVMFICNHCPFVKHIRKGLARFGRDYAARGLAIVAINANDVANYPEDSPEKMKEEALDAGYNFLYLFDATQEVAQAFGAACTPDFFLYDREMRLVYRGQFDASRPSHDTPVTGEDLRRACDALLDRRPVPAEQTPSVGCNIKWKAQ